MRSGSFVSRHLTCLTLSGREKRQDKCQLQCPDDDCHCRLSIRHGSFFWKSKLSLWLQMQIILCFCDDMRVTVCARHLGISRDAAVNYYDNLRGCYIDALENDPVKGSSLGPYEVDEFYIQHVKTRRGGFINLWVQDLYERETGRYTANIVASRDWDALRPAILAFVPPNSLIFTNGWPSYSALESAGYRHFTVNHSAGEYSRQERINGEEVEVSINTLEGLHHGLRQRCANKSGRNVERIELTLKEYSYRRSGRSLFDPFKIHE